MAGLGILERLDGTPARVAALLQTRGLQAPRRPDGVPRRNSTPDRPRAVAARVHDIVDGR
jgi:hypothetical protein